MENEVIITSPMAALEALNRSEIDMQISTAKAYPRDIERAVANVVKMATMDAETAKSCFYHLKRDNKDIDGESVRFAEILVANWGNVRAQSRVIGNDGKFITAQGVCHDLETNSAISTEVKVRITYKSGATYNEDGQMNAGNSSCSKAFRNAVFKCIPKAVVSNAIKEIRKKALENINSEFEEARSSWINYFKELNISIDSVLRYLGRDSIEAITSEDLLTLQGVSNAVADGQTTYETEFSAPVKQEQIAEAAKEKAAAAKQRATKAVQAQQEAK